MNRKSFGNFGEELAADYLKERGYKIVERNYTCQLGEIDIIAKKGGGLYFVEVKTRRDEYFGNPLESITLNKQRQLVKISKYYLMKNKFSGQSHYSAIGIIVKPGIEPDIAFIEDAFVL